MSLPPPGTLDWWPEDASYGVLAVSGAHGSNFYVMELATTQVVRKFGSEHRYRDNARLRAIECAQSLNERTE